MNIKIIVVEPGKKPYVKEIENTLKAFQNEVGGLIEPVYPIQNSSILCYCNEESKFNGSEQNWGWVINGKLADIIFGTFIVLADNGNGGERSLTKEEISMATSFFTKNRIIKYKENYVLTNNANFLE